MPPAAPPGRPPSPTWVEAKRSQAARGIKVNIVVTLVSGHGLKPEDKKTGLSDPYVVLQLGSQKRKSSVVWQNLDPVWNEEFLFTTSATFSKTLQLRVWDRDVGIADRDDFMGKAEVQLGALRDRDEYTYGSIALSTQGTISIVCRKAGEATLSPSPLKTIAAPFQMVGDGIVNVTEQAADAVVSVTGHAADAVKRVFPGQDDVDSEDPMDDLPPTSDHDELMRRFLHRAKTPESIIEAIERAGRHLDNTVVGLLRGTAESTVDSVLAGVGKAVEKSVDVEGAPPEFTARMEVFARQLWTALLPGLRESLLGPVPGDYGAYLIRNWARRYPKFWGPESGVPRPLTWLRARVLYALYPADKTIFQKLRTLPLYWALMALKLDTITGIPVFALQFYLIDRRDEYQLVNFILSFKTFHFLIGVVLAILCARNLYLCLIELNTGGSALDADDPAEVCNRLMTSYSMLFPWQIAFEVPRFGLIAWALYLLVSGRAVGGPGELRALAEVRIDAADGTLDGYSDVAKLGRDPMLMTGRWGTRMPTVAEMDAAKDAARLRFNAETRSGNYLPYFLYVDFAILGLLSLGFGISILRHGYGPGDPMFWHTLYYVKLSYALCAFPFLAFLSPVVGPALHGARSTGYDMAGLCVPKLSNTRIRKKDRLAARRAEDEANRKMQGEEQPWRVAWRESKTRRWLYGLMGLNPIVRSAARSDAMQGVML